MNQQVLILSLAFVVGLAGCETQEEARRRQVKNNLDQVGKALEAYNQKYPLPPPAERAPETAKSDDRERSGKKATISGEVTDFHRSPDGEVDGLELKEGTVRFPPSSRKKVTGNIAVGDTVEIEGWTYSGESEVHAATIRKLGSETMSEVDQSPPDLTE